MLEWILDIDRDLLLHINSWYSTYPDYIMSFITDKWSGVPIYAMVLFFLFYKRNPKVAVIMLIAILLTFALTDFLGVHLFKNVFKKFRPGHDPLTMDFVRILDPYGGKYGFISNHAANFFGFALVSSAFLKKRWYTIFIFSWAIAVAYSRLYLGKHFPLDVICGAMFGALVGYAILLFHRFLVNKFLLYQRLNVKHT